MLCPSGTPTITTHVMTPVLNKPLPEFEAVATKGVGVFDTLKAVAKLVLTELKRGS